MSVSEYIGFNATVNLTFSRLLSCGSCISLSLSLASETHIAWKAFAVQKENRSACAFNMMPTGNDLVVLAAAFLSRYPPSYGMSRRILNGGKEKRTTRLNIYIRAHVYIHIHMLPIIKMNRLTNPILSGFKPCFTG